jgi:hypothetical protein
MSEDDEDDDRSSCSSSEGREKGHPMRRLQMERKGDGASREGGGGRVE